MHVILLIMKTFYNVWCKFKIQNIILEFKKLHIYWIMFGILKLKK